jgi:hypothetical protein
VALVLGSPDPKRLYASRAELKSFARRLHRRFTFFAAPQRAVFEIPLVVVSLEENNLDTSRPLRHFDFVPVEYTAQGSIADYPAKWIPRAMRVSPKPFIQAFKRVPSIVDALIFQTS